MMSDTLTMDVTYDFSKKVVFITGGTGALGRMLVKKFIDKSQGFFLFIRIGERHCVGVALFF